jgi:chromosome segregation ATPase
MDLKEKILVALGINEEEIKLGWQGKSDDGTIFVSTAEELESGVDISVLTEDGTTILLPIGTYKTDSGISFRVDVEGVVAEVIESETEEEETVEELADVGDWEGMEKRIQNLEDAVADLKREKEGGDNEVEMADAETTEEVVEEVVENIEEAVQEIAAAIDDATPAEVTPELATQAAEIAVEVLQEKAEEVVEEADTTLAKKKAKLSKLQKENKKLREKLAEQPAEAPINTNKFSTDRSALSRKEYNKLSKQEKFLYNLNK